MNPARLTLQSKNQKTTTKHAKYAKGFPLRSHKRIAQTTETSMDSGYGFKEERPHAHQWLSPKAVSTAFEGKAVPA